MLERDLLKFCGPTESSLRNLANGVLYYQHYSAYNNPFEFWSNIYEGAPDALREPERFAAALRAWGMEFTSERECNCAIQRMQGLLATLRRDEGRSTNCMFRLAMG